MGRWRDNLPTYAPLAAAMLVLFTVVYGATNYLAALRAGGYRFHADWELALPFVPGMIIVYCSLAVALPLPLFFLEKREIRPYAAAFALATLVAGVCFMILPAPLGFPRPAVVPEYGPVFALLYSVDLPYNTLPSLHIAYGTLTLLSGVRRVPSRVMRTGLALWLVLMCVAVVLVRQHHLADVATGFALGMLCHRAFERWTRRVSSSHGQPARDADYLAGNESRVI